MNRTKKLITILITFLLIMSFVTGCSGKTKTSDTKSTNITNDSTSTNNDGTTNITGKVSAIDGKKITITVFPGKRMRGNRGGRDGRTDKNQDTPGGNPDGMKQPPLDDKDQLPPQGDKDQSPSQDDNTNNSNVPKMESKVITISDESIISIQDGDTITSGTLKDITKDSFLQVTYKKDADGKEVLSSVVVSTLRKRDNSNNNNSNNNNDKNSNNNSNVEK